MALLAPVSHDPTTAKNQLDTIRQRPQNIIQHSPPTSKAGKTTTEQTMSNQELSAIIEKYNLQDRHDLKWQVGDRVQFTQEEYTWGSGDEKKQDAWIGDTATIVSLYDQHFCEQDDFLMWFDVEIDQACLDDDRDRWCRFCVADRHNAINLDRLHWIMNPDYTGKPISIDWAALASKLKITIAELNQCWNNGSIFVFDGLDAICDHYRKSGLDTPAADLLKEEIKDGSVIYTQHLFFMWA